MANLTGTWLGTYWQGQEPTRFELTIVQGGNTLTGNILDDSPLGEATLAGQVVGRAVSFTKTYMTQTYYHISYTGTLSEDETLMQGQWTLQQTLFRDTGAWEARRSNEDLSQQLQSWLAQQKTLVAATSA